MSVKQRTTRKFYAEKSLWWALIGRGFAIILLLIVISVLVRAWYITSTVENKSPSSFSMPKFKARKIVRVKLTKEPAMVLSRSTRSISVLGIRYECRVASGAVIWFKEWELESIPKQEKQRNHIP